MGVGLRNRSVSLNIRARGVWRPLGARTGVLTKFFPPSVTAFFEGFMAPQCSGFERYDRISPSDLSGTCKTLHTKVPKSQFVASHRVRGSVSDTLVNLTHLQEAKPASARAEEDNPSSGLVSLAALKFTADTIDSAKELTTEGISLEDRSKYIRKISDFTGSEVFEFSTCNRVLYVGFGIEPEELGTKISNLNGAEQIPFELYEGTDAWRQLVKICSGLDSFMMGELQVMSQFRKSVNFHRDNELISHYNSAFFEHVISANRSIRKQLGFTQTTESMLSLATSALDDLLAQRGEMNAAVLGFGEMGAKAVEALLEADQRNILVVSRDPARSADRHPELARACTLISYEEWTGGTHDLDLVISTIRNADATYHADNPLPKTGPATLMDFSWPPSIHVSGTTEDQTLLGMEHWIKTSHNLGKEWNYESTIAQSEAIIDDVQQRFNEALTNKTKAQFRALVYGTMERMATTWETSPHASQSDVPQLRAFAREIATWICHQPAAFHLSELSNFVANTPRTLSSAIIAHVDHEVKRSVLVLNEKSMAAGGTS